MTSLLPIEAIKEPLLKALVDHQSVVLTAPPGAGKSTRLPLWLLQSKLFNHQKIYLLQPRRIAAKNIAVYLAQQLGEPVGETVGYRLKNDSKVSSNTRLEVITEGILTQIIQDDPELIGVGLIILDEFHERSLHGDLAFALARDIQQGLRDDLTLLLMSATLASDFLLKALPDAKGIVSEGRSFPIDIRYQPPKTEKLWREKLVSTVKATLLEHPSSSMLVFLPGTGDIHKVANLLIGSLPAHVHLLKLYGQLSIKEQQAVIAPAAEGVIKIVLTTNIAETSLTIEGVDVVIDSGLEKVASYHADILTNHLVQRKISKASAVQRAGRAGRLKAGICIRIFSEEDFGRRAEHTDSEILHGDLLPLVIESARWGVKALNELPLLELPPQSKELLARQELQHLGLLTENNVLTTLGQQISNLPCHPRYARMIIQASTLERKHTVDKLLSLACIIAAMLEEKDVFSNEQARFDCNLNHRIAFILSRQSTPLAQKIKQQAMKYFRRISRQGFAFEMNLPLEYSGALLALAYPERIAKARSTDGEYLSAQGKGLSVNHEDAMANEPLIVTANVSSFTKNTLQVRIAAAVELSLLLQWEIIKETSEQVASFDVQNQRIIASEQTRLGAIVLNEKNTTNALLPEKVKQLWLQEVMHNGLQWLKFDQGTQALLLRWRWVNKHLVACRLPLADEASLIDSLGQWFTPYVENILTKKALNKLNFSSMLLSLLTYQQQQLLLQVAPLYFIGPTGRKCPITYNDEKSPKVSLPMQEVYGMQNSPMVGVTTDVAKLFNSIIDEAKPASTSIPLTLELLSPAQRPIQITQNLTTFWQGSYLDVQKDMKSNYPKHFWPDDPANAKPTNKTKRHLL